MKKRQIKKNEKKHVKLIADEMNLTLMNPEERKKAINEYLETRKRLARIRYRDLKNMKTMIYYFHPGESMRQYLTHMGKRLRSGSGQSNSKPGNTITQSLADFNVSPDVAAILRKNTIN